ncbi:MULTISPECIES: hypothetical protein [unclassified Chryseobacterium]|uniref:hypothetical protein n=1 Tax=unclassified Chryseobacterium TaxID=2593645 RepID=UPI000E0ACE92|nr:MULTISPECIES: hypothetical protein [unclassified Chryseobacterium]MDQ1857314.1 hypothetical protein [Chryseobacterium sp. WLY505]
MEKELYDFKCALEATIVAMQKAGTIRDFYEMTEFTEQEQWIKDYIVKNGVKFFVTHPIGDEEFRVNSGVFQQRVPNLAQELYVDFRLFETLVRDRLNEGYTLMKISFREITDSNISEYSRILGEENQMFLKSKKEYLYATLSFHVETETEAKPAKHYFIFNLDTYYEINVNSFGDFNRTRVGQILINASSDAYVAECIRYDLILVKQYIDRIHMYLEGCLRKNVVRLDFIPCIGRKKTMTFATGKESLYLATMPSDNNKQLLSADFPYYDQGSLEP